MKKYKVTVEQTKEYEIEIDETQFTQEHIKMFEAAMWNLDEIRNDKYASIAYELARIRALDLSHEGFGYPLIKGENLFCDGEENTAFNFTEIDEDDCDIDVKEIR